MREKLELIDRDIFLALNGLHTDVLDSFMFLVSHKFFWIPVYVLIFIVMQRKYGWARLGYFTIGVGLTIALCDQFSSSIIKPWIARYRPCKNLEIMDIVHTVRGKCGSGFSFTSSHATNIFGVALFSANALGRGKYAVILLSWAALIAYSRVYLGVHYPSDILSGTILGLMLGYIVSMAYKWVISKKFPA